mmetsp:Transcript_36522/g.58654  ORF Transcript_36522/g.58654 Transcript_36522/m.58654 type:complete len:209 (+) Transcript_36522:144-770(+)
MAAILLSMPQGFLPHLARRVCGSTRAKRCAQTVRGGGIANANVSARASSGGSGDSAAAAPWTGDGIEVASENQRRDLAVVLVNPQIPGNTGTIARTCAATRVPLHLVGPLGFDLTDSQLKRAGLDYWNSVCVKVHDDWGAFHRYWRDDLGAPGRLVAFSKFGARPHAEEGAYLPGDWLLFGAETTGLPDEAHDACTASVGGVDGHVSR